MPNRTRFTIARPLRGVFLGVAALCVSNSAAAASGQTGQALTTDSPVTIGVPAGFRSESAQLDGVKIHYLIGGAGPPLLLIHGWPESWYEWRKMMPLLAKRFTVIVPDLRGIGDSSAEPTGYDKKTLAQDMHALMAKLGYPTAILVGHDWGGPVTYAYAAQYRQAVSKLVMIEGAPFGSWTADPAPLWFFAFFAAPGYAESLLPGRETPFLRYFYVNPQFHVVPGAFDETSIAAYTRAYSRPGRMNATYGLYRSIPQDIRDNDGFAKTPLALPVMAIGAETGNGEAVIDSARKVAVNVTPLLFKGTGHFIPEERPELLAKLIEQFLDGQAVPAVWQP